MADSQPADRVAVRRGPHGKRTKAEKAAAAETCRRCGEVHPHGCNGHPKIRNEAGEKIGIRPCKKFPMKGQSVCYKHGGMGRNRAAGLRQWDKEHARAKEMERAERAVKTLGLPVATSPQQALLDEIARTAGHVRWLGDLVGNLDPDESTWGKTGEEHREGVGEMETVIDLTTTTKQARPAVWIQLYQAERSHLVHVCKVAIQCGIAERQIKLAEEQGQMIASVLRSVFEDPELELSVTQVQVARNVASKALRALSVVGARPSLSVLPEP